MNLNNIEFKREEQAAFALRSLYRKFGYSQYKMSKFEEYDLYVRNKDFLISDSVITFTDTNGRLMALKPDVTLSIIKNSKDGGTEKVYYNENVYRVSNGTHSYKEIMQVGLERIGDIDLYGVYEVVMLAAQSLSLISPECVLDISHMGIVTSLLKSFGVSPACEKEIMRCIGEKNVHEASAAAQAEGVSQEKIAVLKEIISLHGSPKAVLPRLVRILGDECKEAFNELEQLVWLLEKSSCADVINIDFSVINDMNYYNGIVFKGFVKSVPSGILSGGQYDNLMHRMKKKSGAIGFAVYLDLLEGIASSAEQFDVDAVILYDESTDLELLSSFVGQKTAQGMRVTAVKNIPQKLRYKQLYKICNREVKTLENNA